MREEKGLEEKLVGFSVRNSLEILENVDVGYYFGERPNPLKTLMFFFLANSSLFIAATQPRGADHVIGSNFTLTTWR